MARPKQKHDLDEEERRGAERERMARRLAKRYKHRGIEAVLILRRAAHLIAEGMV